jgi:hypothetical protein
LPFARCHLGDHIGSSFQEPDACNPKQPAREDLPTEIPELIFRHLDLDQWNFISAP